MGPLTLAVLAVLVGVVIALRGVVWRAYRIFHDDNVGKDVDHVRLGIIGAANIAKFAVIYPARKLKTILLSGVASRDPARAVSFGQKYSIPAAETYNGLLNDASIDAVYIALITPLHYKWAKAALLANKHVLVEKPIAMNAEEADDLAALAAAKNLVLMEGYHYRYHPSALRWKDIIQTEIGEIRQVSARFTMFDPKTWFPTKASEHHLRVKMLDRWCYCADMLRLVVEMLEDGSSEMLNVTSAAVPLRGAVMANLTAGKAMKASFLARKDALEMPEWDLRVEGSQGTLQVTNVGFPFLYHRIGKTKKGDSVTQTEQVYGQGETTFEHQLATFAAAVKAAKNESTSASARLALSHSAVRNMRIIDSVFERAGLPVLHSTE